MPGRTPTKVPRATPTKAQTRFMGVTATLKPWKRAPRVSMGRFPSGGDRAGGEWARKQDHNSPFKKPAKMPAGSRRPRPQVKPIGVTGRGTRPPTEMGGGGGREKGGENGEGRGVAEV